MEVLVFFSALFVALVCGVIGLWFGDQRNRQIAGFWLGFFLGPFGWLLTLLLPTEDGAQADAQADVSVAGQTSPEQRGIGRCPTCGGGLLGPYAKCPHCASDVFWAGTLPMRTAQEVADEQERQERLAAQRREQEERLAAQKQRQFEETVKRQREAERQYQEQKREAERRWEEQKREAIRRCKSAAWGVLSAFASGARRLARKSDPLLRPLAGEDSEVLFNLRIALAVVLLSLLGLLVWGAYSLLRGL